MSSVFTFNTLHVDCFSNPRRGWNIAQKVNDTGSSVLRYYSYPLTNHPPPKAWISQRIEPERVPKVVSAEMLHHNLLDLLFIGFSRSEEWTINWWNVPTEVVQIFIDYFVMKMNNTCGSCDGQCMTAHCWKM